MERLRVFRVSPLLAICPILFMIFHGPVTIIVTATVQWTSVTLEDGVFTVFAAKCLLPPPQRFKLTTKLRPV